MYNQSTKNIKAALYIRLSREDEDKQEVSESIKNQKSLLLQYTKENNISIYDIYIDDGYSGTNFNRPAFKKMINDIELGNVNMVITKDMSRLGRDYIGTGEMLEKYFPKHGVRYIAITDNIDTYLDTSQNDVAPFKAIMNDMYAKDISKKIKASFHAKQKEGKWISGRSPFGYDIDPNDKNHLIINEEKALVVKEIFRLSLNGLSFYKIAKYLTENNVKTPASYYSFKWKASYHIDYSKWHSKTIHDILTNRMYIGDLVQNKRSKVNYKVKKVVSNEVSKYVIVEGTHDAIIDKETFFNVQKRLPKNVGRISKKEHHLLDALLYCGDCHHRISVTARRKKDGACYTICNYYRTYINKKLCKSHSNNYDKLEITILNKLKEIIMNNIDRDKIKKEVLNSSLNINNDYKRELKILNTEIQKLNDNLDNLYLDKLNNVITNDMYERLESKLTSALKLKTNRASRLNSLFEKEEALSLKSLTKYLDDYLRFESIDRELVVNLIEKIEIFEDKTIDVYLSFKAS